MDRSATPAVPSPLKYPVSPPPIPAAPKSSALSFAQRKANLSRTSSPLPMEGNKIMRDIDQPLPGDVSANRRTSRMPADLARRKSAYFESEFAASSKDPDPAKFRVRNEAIVMAELKTNVIIDDEFNFITDLSYHLSNRYQRPMSSIVINLQHGCCMMYGGSFDPAYTLAIHGIPSLVQPTTNKRNATLIQNHIQETLHVVPARGYVRFIPTPEENVAFGGKTLAAEMDGIDGNDDAENDREKRFSRAKKAKSFRTSLGGFKRQPSIELARLPTPPSSADDGPLAGNQSNAPEDQPNFPFTENPFDDNAGKKANRPRSFVTALFSKQGAVKSGGRPKTSSGPL